MVPRYEHRMNTAVIHFIVKRNVREIGLDCEWPNNGPVSLIQIATEDCVILFQVCRFENKHVLPRELASILKNDYYVKVGVDIEENVTRIKDRFGVSVHGWIDLRCFAIGNNLLAEHLLEQLEYHELQLCQGNMSPSSKREERLNFMPGLGLAALVGACLDKSLKGTPEDILIEAYGNWGSDKISDEEEVFAAAGAASSLDVFNVLQSLNVDGRNLRFVEASYDHKRIRLDCLDLISSIAPDDIYSILPHYYETMYSRDVKNSSESEVEKYVEMPKTRIEPEAAAERGKPSRVSIWQAFIFFLLIAVIFCVESFRL